MTIQPLPPSQPPEISVTEAIEPAYERVKLMLFQPFNLTKWLIVGFCAWLAGLGESGGGGSGYNGFNNYNNNGHNGDPAEGFRHFYQQASDYVMANLYWIVPASIVVLLLILALVLLIFWLNSRGKFMFLHCVALNATEVDVPWRKYAGVANSLFRFRIVVWFLGMILFLPLVVFLAMDIIRMLMQNEADAPGVMLGIGLFLALLFLSLIFGLIHKFTVDFVVPILYLRGGTCMAAWREFWGLLAANPGRFTVYVLFQIVLGMAIGALVGVVFVVTCCIACCLVAIPFIGTVVLLPVLVFKRAYPLYYLAQYGPQYDVFPKLPPATSSGANPTPGLVPIA